MRIRDIGIRDVAAGMNWRLIDDFLPSIVEWEVEECTDFQLADTIVYSGLTVFETGEVRPILLVREVGSYEWWGDTCEQVNGAWRELEQVIVRPLSEEYIAAPLPMDPSFMCEYSHEKQREGFLKYRNYLCKISNDESAEP